MHRYRSDPDVSKPLSGLAYFALSVGTEEAVRQKTEDLRSAGLRIVGEPRWTGDGYYESLILDPEGKTLEVTI
jgi:lactoylglutathione lyase